MKAAGKVREQEAIAADRAPRAAAGWAAQEEPPAEADASMRAPPTPSRMRRSLRKGDAPEDAPEEGGAEEGRASPEKLLAAFTRRISLEWLAEAEKQTSADFWLESPERLRPSTSRPPTSPAAIRGPSAAGGSSLLSSSQRALTAISRSLSFRRSSASGSSSSSSSSALLSLLSPVSSAASSGSPASAAELDEGSSGRRLRRVDSMPAYMPRPGQASVALLRAVAHAGRRASTNSAQAQSRRRRSEQFQSRQSPPSRHSPPPPLSPPQHVGANVAERALPALLLADPPSAPPPPALPRPLVGSEALTGLAKVALHRDDTRSPATVDSASSSESLAFLLGSLEGGGTPSAEAAPSSQVASSASPTPSDGPASAAGRQSVRELCHSFEEAS